MLTEYHKFYKILFIVTIKMNRKAVAQWLKGKKLIPLAYMKKKNIPSSNLL